MSLQIVRTDGLSGQEVFQKILEDVPGGGTLKITELKAATTWLNKGAPVQYVESTRVVNLVKTALLYANATDSAVEYQVGKNHEFKVGEYLAGVVGGKAYAITEIDTSNALYDILTVGTTLAVAWTATDIVVLFISSATGASVAAYTYTANGILRSGVKIDQANTAATAVAIVTRGTVYERRLPFSLSAKIKTALGARFIFSSSY
jgi:hypothetical protein